MADWRRFLDLVDDAAASTKAEDLLETWVLTPKQDAELLGARARPGRRISTRREGDGWLPGIVVRKPMGDWRFARPTAAIDDADEVLATRATQLETATGRLGLAAAGGAQDRVRDAARPTT